MSWLIGAIAKCRPGCKCLTEGEVIVIWRGDNVHSRMPAERATIFLATKIIANATVVMLPRCSIRKFGARLEAREKKLRDGDFTDPKLIDTRGLDRIKKAQAELAKNRSAL